MRLKPSSAAMIIQHTGYTGLLVATYERARAELARRLLGRSTIKRRVGQFSLNLDVADPGISRSLMLYGIREKDHIAVLDDILRPGMRIFDVGANIGYYAILELRSIGPQGKLLAIEPAPQNVALLRSNLDMNGGSAVPIVEAAVSGNEGTGYLHIERHSNLHRLASGSNQPAGGVEVPLRSLEELAREWFVPDFLRMDIEGHEVEVLRSIADSSLRPLILFEAHPVYYSTENDIAGALRALEEVGYTVRVAGSADPGGSSSIESRGYRSYLTVDTDATTRDLFANVTMDDLVYFAMEAAAVRTVLLAPDQKE